MIITWLFALIGLSRDLGFSSDYVIIVGTITSSVLLVWALATAER